jgi:hypothetical protein
MLAVQSENKLNGLVVEGCLDKRVLEWDDGI